MPREAKQHWGREHGGGRPISDRLQTERRGNRSTSPGVRLAEAPRRDREEAADDRRIRSLVQRKLAMFGPLVEDEVNVSVHNGRVLLSGSVQSEYERQSIVHEIERIAFVKHVRCGLTIGEETDGEVSATDGAPLVRPQLVVALSVLTIAAVGWWIWNFMQQTGN